VIRFFLKNAYIIFFLVQTNIFCQSVDSIRVKLSQQKDTTKLISLLKIGDIFYNSGQLDSAMVYLKDGLSKANNLKNFKFRGAFLIKLGLMEREKGVYNKASEYYYKALEIADKNSFVGQKASCYNGIAIISAIQKDFKKAVEYYNKSLDIYKATNNLSGLSSIYNNIGLLYLDQKNNSTGLKYFLKALDINKSLSNDFGIAVNSENIGLIYDQLNDFNLAFIYFGKALKIWYQRNDDNSISINQGYMGNSYIKQKKWQRAVDTLQKSLLFAKKANSLPAQRDNSYYLSTAYEGLNDTKNSLEYFKFAKQLGDSIQNNEKTKEITEIQLNYAFNKIKVQDSIKHQLEVQVKENQLKTEKNYKYIVSSVLFLILILLFFVFKNYKEKTKANSIITEQKNIVEKKQKEIVDSITYARRIQSALLAHKEFINQNINDHFVLFKPKDIVSGDFYWATKKGDNFYLAVCDSTGHGVPGAFMSLLNIGFLSEAISEKNILAPNDILNYVRERLISSVSKDGQQDGFDGILLCINQKTNAVSYAASHNSPIVISDSSIIQMGTDKMPVGKGVKETPFKLFEMNVKPKDTIYLYTDGYADQFGGINGKKFLLKKLNELIASISIEPLSKQKEILDKRFEDWRGNLEQVDDVLVIGIRI